MNLITIDPATGQTRLLNRNPLFWLAILVGIVLFFSILVFIINNTLVDISYKYADQARPGKVTITGTDSKSNQFKFSPLFGSIGFIPRSTATITAQTTDSATTVLVTSLPFFSIPKFTLELQPQHEVSHIATDSKGCTFINPNGTFTSNCASISDIYQVNRPDSGIWTTSYERAGFDASAFSRYKDGYLVIQYPVRDQPAAAPLLLYTIPGGSTEQFSLPADFAKSANDTFNILTDQVSGTVDDFIIANITTGDFIYMPRFDQTAQSARFLRKTTINSQFDASRCSLQNTQLVCYYGPFASSSNDVQGDSNYAAYRQKHPYGTIESLSITNPTQRHIYSLKAIDAIDNIYQSGSGTIYLISRQQLYQAIPSGDELNVHLIASGVTTTGAGQQSVPYMTNNGIFEYIESQKTAYLRFTSTHLRMADMQVFNGQITINAFINTTNDQSDVGTPAHSYLLTSKVVSVGEKRKEDYLPYDDSTLPKNFLDYDDKRIYINVDPVLENNPDGTVSIDQTATQDKANKLRQRLESDGLVQSDTVFIFPSVQ